MYEIEKDVPIPSQDKGTRTYPLKDMKVGDSFAVPAKHRTNLMSAITSHRKKNKALRFTTRTEGKGGDTVRCWRIE